MMESTRKRDRLQHWACSRGFAFIAYLMIAASASALYLENPPPPVGADESIAALAALIAGTLILAALASGHAVIYGLGPINTFLVKLEIPSLRILAFIIGIHGILDAMDGDIPSGTMQLGLAALLFHEMRAISHLRKGVSGGLINP